MAMSSQYSRQGQGRGGWGGGEVGTQTQKVLFSYPYVLQYMVQYDIKWQQMPPRTRSVHSHVIILLTPAALGMTIRKMTVLCYRHCYRNKEIEEDGGGGGLEPTEADPDCLYIVSRATHLETGAAALHDCLPSLLGDGET
jgi:hypothetical protein